MLICLSLSAPQPTTVPTASILGGPDLYVDKGSTINLTCVIKFSPEPPTHIFWYHQDKVSTLHINNKYNSLLVNRSGKFLKSRTVLNYYNFYTKNLFHDS